MANTAISIRDIITKFNEFNANYRKAVEATPSYKKYLSREYTSNWEAQKLIWAAEEEASEVKKSGQENLLDFLKKATEFKEGSPYIDGLAVSVNGQKLVIGPYRLNGDVASYYKQFIKEQNEKNKENVAFNVGDIYVADNRFFRVKKTTKTGVSLEELAYKIVSTDFNKDDYWKKANNEENYRIFEFSYCLSCRWEEPYYPISFEVVPANTVIGEVRTSVVFEKGKTILRNKRSSLDITEKWDGTPITRKTVREYNLNSFLEDASNPEDFQDICSFISTVSGEHNALCEERLAAFLATEEGRRRNEELARLYEERAKECEEYNAKYNDVGLSKDIWGSSVDVYTAFTSPDKEKVLEGLKAF